MIGDCLKGIVSGNVMRADMCIDLMLDFQVSEALHLGLINTSRTIAMGVRL